MPDPELSQEGLEAAKRALWNPSERYSWQAWSSDDLVRKVVTAYLSATSQEEGRDA